MRMNIVAEVAIILLIDYTSVGQALFGTAAIDWRAAAKAASR